MNVGIRELKTHLSAYVKRAGRGEQILVTDRGRPVARLVCLEKDSKIEQGIAEGWIIPPTKGKMEPIAPIRTRRNTAEVLDEDRG